jgi:radical SAM superfamily enzyme YgiQ (UPF0313 family)
MIKVIMVAPYYHNIWEPLGLGYLASYLKKHIKDIDIKFFHENFDDPMEFHKAAIYADIVCITSTTPTFRRAKQLATGSKYVNKKIKTIVGGWHVTALPQTITDIDHIVIGEGEKALCDIIQNGSQYPIIKGTKLQFEDLPWPDRELIRQDRTLALCESHGSGRIGSFQSRRGCMMHCSICAEKIMTGWYNSKKNPVRVRDPEDLLDEITTVNNKYNLTRFKFVDPTWCFPKKAAYDFCEAKLKRDINLPWELMAHAAYLDEDLLKLMKRAGCDQINVGCESGSQKILNDMRKGVTVEQIKKVFKIGKSLGINMRSFFILGLPNETRETIEETRQLAREINPDVFGITILCPYPGSDYYADYYKNEDWSKADEYSNDFWSSIHFSNAELKEIQKEFEDEFRDKLNWHQRTINNA